MDARHLRLVHRCRVSGAYTLYIGAHPFQLAGFSRSAERSDTAHRLRHTESRAHLRIYSTGNSCAPCHPSRSGQSPSCRRLGAAFNGLSLCLYGRVSPDIRRVTVAGLRGCTIRHVRGVDRRFALLMVALSQITSPVVSPRTIRAMMWRKPAPFDERTESNHALRTSIRRTPIHKYQPMYLKR